MFISKKIVFFKLILIYLNYNLNKLDVKKVGGINMKDEPSN